MKKLLAAMAVLAAVAGAGVWLWTGRGPGPVAEPVDTPRALYDRGDYRAAAAAARDRLRARPDDASALRVLARSSARQGRHDVARGLFERLGADRWEAEDDFLLAAGYDVAARQDLARAALVRALGREPLHPDSLFVLARLDAADDDLLAAASLAERLARVPGWEARGSALLGSLRLDSADPAGAAEALERALQVDPELKGATLTPVQARAALVRAWLALGRPAQARRVLGDPATSGVPDADWLLGRVRLQEGHPSGTPDPAPDRDPTAPEPAALVGADRCVECHKGVATAQRASRHARTFTPPERSGGVTIPERPVTDPHDAAVAHTFRRERDAAQLETRRGGDLARAVVTYVLGSGRRAQTLLGRDDAGRDRELRLTRYQGTTWDLTTGVDPHPVPADAHEFLGKPISADGVRRCLLCHTTDFRAARDRTAPAGLDSAIGCERCHGPGGNHLAAVALDQPDLAIARPKRATGPQVDRLCGNCHSPRGHELSPDAPAAARFQASTLGWSRCATGSGGRLSCLTCHDPHRDAETSPAFYESRCLGCHAKTPPEPVRTASRTRPAALPEGKAPVVCPVEPTRDCLRCHMPPVEASVPHTKYTDHHIRARRGAAATAGR